MKWNMIFEKSKGNEKNQNGLRIHWCHYFIKRDQEIVKTGAGISKVATLLTLLGGEFASYVADVAEIMKK